MLQHGQVHMRTCWRLFYFVCALLPTSLLQAQSPYRAAAAEIDITPPTGTWLAGYGRERASTGTLDPLWAKVLVIQDDQTTLVLITLDNIGLTRPDVLRLQQAVRAYLPDSQVIVSSTHTHAGPDVVGIWGASWWRSGRNESYMTATIERIARLAQAIFDRRTVVSVHLASAQQPLGWVQNLSEPQLLDQRLAVLHLIDETDQTVATLANYACHPTVLGPENTRVSADYVNGFYARMGEKYSGVHFFLQGAIGGWVQPIQGDRSPQLARELGSSLAEATATILTTATLSDNLPIRFATATVDVPLTNWGFRVLIWLGVLERTLYEGAMRTSVATFNIGQAQFVTHPGETSPAYSLQTRRWLNSPHSFVLGLSQDAMGYILKPEYFAAEAVYPHGDYLTSVSVGPEAGPLIMRAIKGLLRARALAAEVPQRAHVE